MRLYINNLKEGDILDNHKFGIADFERRTSKSGNYYYNVTLADKTGDISAKIWSSKFSDCDLENVNIGDVVEVSGRVDSYNGNEQVIIEKLKKAEDFDPSHFIKEGEKDRDELFEEILKEVKNLEDEEIRELILSILEDKDLKKKFKEYPAGMYVHHGYVGGILEHVHDMLMISKSIRDVYPRLNYSELVFGILFHDIGKIEELDIEGVSIVMSYSGNLLGHIVQGVSLLQEHFPKDFDKRKKDRLLHMVVSHHGTEEFGSPVKPSTVEALVLSYLDDMSSKMGIAEKHLDEEEIDSKGISAYNKYLQTSVIDSLFDDENSNKKV